MASLDTVPLTGPSVQSFAYTVGVPGGVVQTFTYVCPSGPPSDQAFSYNIPANTSYCWDSKAQRLLEYLGAPFLKTVTGLLGFFMRTVARELSTCTEVVTMTGTSDARGTGAFSIEVRFHPIEAVNTVTRVDVNGSVLETYTVTGYDGRLVSLTGVTPPRQGDRLAVTYSYRHQGLEFDVNQALKELNILTASSIYLDQWGSLFNVARGRSGKYGSLQYGVGNKYGTAGSESDGNYSRRLIATVTANRNTKTAIIAAVQKLTGGSPYIVEWAGNTSHRAFIFRPSGDPAWAGQNTEVGQAKHLIWGKTARFINTSVSNGGAYVFEVWVPSGTGLTTSQILTVVNSLKVAGSKAYIRFF
jgi:hypothetical protein